MKIREGGVHSRSARWVWLWVEPQSLNRHLLSGLGYVPEHPVPSEEGEHTNTKQILQSGKHVLQRNKMKLGSLSKQLSLTNCAQKQ